MDERKRLAEKASDDSTHLTKRQKIGHDRTKSQQVQLAEDVLHTATRYSPERIKALPEIVQKKASISTISARGFRFVENELAADKMRDALARKKKSKVKTQTFAEYKEIASKLVPNNDSSFTNMSQEEKEKRQDIERYAQHTFWSSLSLKDGFKEQLKKVLPGFWESRMQSMSKKSIMVLLKKYLEFVRNIASLKVVKIRNNECNDFTMDELNSMDDIDRLSKFIYPSGYLSEMRLSKKRTIDAIKNMSKHNGTEISMKKARW